MAKLVIFDVTTRYTTFLHNIEGFYCHADINKMFVDINIMLNININIMFMSTADINKMFMSAVIACYLENTSIIVYQKTERPISS